MALLATASACGFRPLYGERSGSVNEAALAGVSVVPLRDRSGQLLYTHLTKGLHARGRARNPQWQLSIKLDRRVERLGIRKDETATRANLTFVARFQLRDLRTKKVAFQGRSVISSSYDILKSRYGTIASEKTAVERATRLLAENIKARVAIFLTGAGRRR